ncbi:MAG: uroporphyrinogen decarboxylase [Gammaproteobacteria bacterium]
MALQNDRLIKALLRQPVDKTPVWIMRQAGRYLPEYRALRAQAGSFLNLMRTPEWACEATLQPLARFDLDAAILFSDILTIPGAMGLGLNFAEGEGPQFAYPIKNAADVAKLHVPDPVATMPFVYDTIRLIKQELQNKVPLIGFAGSPWTLATYMVEGRGTKEFAKVKEMMYASPVVMTQLLKILSDSVTEYLNAQIDAGVDAVMIFDTWGGVLTPQDYVKFSLEPMQRIVEGLKKSRNGQRIPNILFTKGGGQWLELMSDTGCDALGLDWTINIGEARERVGNKVALQGNLDPAVLYAPAEVVEAEVTRVMNSFGKHPGHVFNLGHGIHPGIDPENVKVLVDTVHRL